MRKTIRKIVIRFLRNRIIWCVIAKSAESISTGYEWLDALRNFSEEKTLRERAIHAAFFEKRQKILSGLTVLNGPFKGMKYPYLKSAGSSIFPKIIGSYEKELSEIIAAILQQDYETIVDIGCAEGYYAIGLGMHMRNAKIFAYDTDEEALRLCKEMGDINGVKVHVGQFCDKDILTNLNIGERALIISDCEGYETKLFDEETADCLKHHDLLIESHDMIDLGTTRMLLSVFSKTHNCEIVESIDDIVKAYTYDYEELNDFTLQERHRLVAEGRTDIMRWIFAKSRHPGRDKVIVNNARNA